MSQSIADGLFGDTYDYGQCTPIPKTLTEPVLVPLPPAPYLLPSGTMH
ncbi:hypothetical protein [Providencia rettgeri]|nr:hypothetical protein [Providencia rettgeri]MBI6192219.1 hypothetical protein [Providencia rettgeri]